MSEKTYHGSCSCEKVRFEADIDITKGTGKCNCTVCMKMRNWSVTLKPEKLRVTAGKDDLSDYAFDFGPHGNVHHQFCKHCGVRPFGYGSLPQIGGPYVSVKISALDDLDWEEVMKYPIQYFDGLHDNWMSTPKYTGHL